MRREIDAIAGKQRLRRYDSVDSRATSQHDQWLGQRR